MNYQIKWIDRQSKSDWLGLAGDVVQFAIIVGFAAWLMHGVWPMSL